MDEKCHVDPMNKFASPQQLRDADRALLSVGGMGCENCATRVRNGLLSVEGVFAANVYLNVGLAEVFYDNTKVSTAVLKNAVHNAGNDGHEYEAMLIMAE